MNNIIDSRVNWISLNKNSGKIYQKESMLFIFLELWINAAITQRSRIEIDKIKLNKALQKRRTRNIMNMRVGNSWTTYQKRLFTDIHFLLISMANLSKIMESLKKVKSHESDFVAIYKKHNAFLKRLRNLFRNLLEHISENYIFDGKDKNGKQLKNPGDLGNLNGDNYTLFGESFSLSHTFKLLDDLCNDLSKWSDDKVRSLPPPNNIPEKH